MSDIPPADPGYNGLFHTEPTLRREDYIDPGVFQRELHAIWYRTWVYACQALELAATGDFRLLEIGDQQLIVLRDETGALQAFHNTCRHRGSVLLTEPAGTLRGAITCPYHAWRYSLQGELLRTPGHYCQAGFDPATQSLYDVAVTQWRGMVFVNLDRDSASPVATGMDCGGQALAHWPLEELQLGHRLRKDIACNWKVFWENFNECLHCPGVHPELSGLVPLYRRALMETRDDPHWMANNAKDDPRFKAGLAPGAQTWSADGQPSDEPFIGLDEDDIARGHTYEVLLPTLFMVGHVDYVRIVSLLPVSTEKTALEARWLFRPETLARDDFDPAGFAAFAETVLEQDARVAELNQRGLHCLRHEQGTLLAEEYEVHNFHNWVRAQRDKL